MTDPLNRVPFPQAGEGACLRFRTMDYVALRTEFGEPKLIEQEFAAPKWETFTTRLDSLLINFDPLAIISCLKAGLKQEDGRTPWTKIDWSDLGFSLIGSVAQIQDALVLALTNQPYAKLLAEQTAEEARNRRLRAAGVEFNEDDPPDPSMAPTMPASSGESSGSDTPPAS